MASATIGPRNTGTFIGNIQHANRYLNSYAHFKEAAEKRGYNQSQQLALGCLSLLKKSGINASIVPLLEKIQDKKSQVEVSPFERWTNLRGSLRVSPKTKQRIPGDALLVLIDDTVTTGSTLIYAAEVIRKEFPEQPLHLLALALEV